MAKTLVVGATGHLGQELVKACKAQGDEVHALVRAATREDVQKMKPLDAAGATIHEGELDDVGALVRACKAVDNVISAVGSMQIGIQAPLVKAVKEAGVKRFIPSDFGLDPKVAGPGSCLAFDWKAGVHESIKQAGIPYTFVHTGGFFSYWVVALGDLTKLGAGPLPPAEVIVYGDGNVKGSFSSVADIAAITARAVNDAALRNREIRIASNPTTQNELIELWRRKSGKAVKTLTLSADGLEKIIASSTAPEQGMMLVVAQLHRSLWIRGDSTKPAAVALDAQQVYPDVAFETIEQGFSRLS